MDLYSTSAPAAGGGVRAPPGGVSGPEHLVPTSAATSLVSASLSPGPRRPILLQVVVTTCFRQQSKPKLDFPDLPLVKKKDFNTISRSGLTAQKYYVH